jgi:hypothetical protein
MGDMEDQIAFLRARIAELEEGCRRAIDASGCGCHPTGMEDWRYSDDGQVHRGQVPHGFIGPAGSVDAVPAAVGRHIARFGPRAVLNWCQAIKAKVARLEDMTERTLAGDDPLTAGAFVTGLAFSLRYDLVQFDGHPDFRRTWGGSPQDWRGAYDQPAVPEVRRQPDGSATMNSGGVLAAPVDVTRIEVPGW